MPARKEATEEGEAAAEGEVTAEGTITEDGGQEAPGCKCKSERMPRPGLDLSLSLRLVRL